MKFQQSCARGWHVLAGLPGLLLVGLAVVSLAGCGGSQQAPQSPAAIQKGDVCAVCGMYIDASPGPRGEAYVEGHRVPLKFDSTRDFFAYALQPENKRRLQQLFVQDSERISWQHPSSQARTFVDARSAYYVAWQPLGGSMGPTFASFAQRSDAEAFVRAHGGAILRFADVTAELTSRLGYGCPAKGSPAFALAKGCIAAPHVAGAALTAQREGLDLLHRSTPIQRGMDPGWGKDRMPLLEGKPR